MTTKTLRDKELQDHYDQIFAMYGTRGWARLQEDLNAAIRANDTVADLTSEQQLWFRKGELSQMLWLQNHQAAHEAAYAALLAEQEGDEGVGTVAEGRAKVIE